MTRTDRRDPESVPVVTTVADRAGVDIETRRGLLECWVEVSNAGGAVGFPFPPVAEQAVAADLDAMIDDLAPEACVLFVARSGSSIDGWVVLRRDPAPLVAHVGTVQRLQTRPDRRGRGTGAALMAALEGYAQDSLGVEQLRLAVRGGMGLEEFYLRRGYAEVGRLPGALRLAPGDDRDDVVMWRALDA